MPTNETGYEGGEDASNVPDGAREARARAILSTPQPPLTPATSGSSTSRIEDGQQPDIQQSVGPDPDEMPEK